MTETMTEVAFHPAGRHGNLVTVFRQDHPKAKEGEEVIAYDDVARWFATVLKVNKFAITMQLGDPCVVTPVAPDPGGPNPPNHEPWGNNTKPLTEVHYAPCIGGYVLIDPNSGERICTPHPNMSDISKVAKQKGWVIVAKWKGEMK